MPWTWELIYPAPTGTDLAPFLGMEQRRRRMLGMAAVLALVIAPAQSLDSLEPASAETLGNGPDTAGTPARRDQAGTPPKEQVGTASWYGQWHHGRETASGTIFDMYRLTAAHRTLPLGSRVQVTALESGRSVEVTITDRGPYVGGRVIDLSYAAADRLAAVERGVIPVRLRVMPERRHLVVADGGRIVRHVRAR
jgi:rare lipoprotein A